ncbi:MAG: PadR family transcriptional regulator [Sciscionella sp.]
MSSATYLVLYYLLTLNEDQRYGLEVIRKTGLPSGTVYPILSRLEDGGLIESWWKESPDRRPRRRMYRLTAKGEEHTREARAALAPSTQGMIDLHGRNASPATGGAG